MLPKPKIIIIGLVFLLLILIIIGLAWKYMPLNNFNDNSGVLLGGNEVIIDQEDTGRIITNTFESNVIGDNVGEPAQTARVGDLEISFYGIEESEYEIQDFDENFERVVVSVRYLGVELKIFNQSRLNVENIEIILRDDQGNEYKVNRSVDGHVLDLKYFGDNMVIYSRIMQEGYIYFTDISDEAKSFELIVNGKESEERAVFKFNRE